MIACRSFIRNVSHYFTEVASKNIGESLRKRFWTTVMLSGISLNSDGADKTLKLTKEDLSYDSLIRQACLTSINSASVMLTVTTHSILEVRRIYFLSLQELILLMEQSSTLDYVPEDQWDAIISARAKANEQKSNLSQLEKFMSSVERLVLTVSENAFLAGAEYLCTQILERLESSKLELTRTSAEVRKLETEYLKLHATLVLKTKTNESTT